MTWPEYLKNLKEVVLDLDKDFDFSISCEEHGEFHSENLDYFTENALNISIKCSKCKVDVFMCAEYGPHTLFSK